MDLPKSAIPYVVAGLVAAQATQMKMIHDTQVVLARVEQKLDDHVASMNSSHAQSSQHFQPLDARFFADNFSADDDLICRD